MAAEEDKESFTGMVGVSAEGRLSVRSAGLSGKGSGSVGQAKSILKVMPHMTE